MAANVKNVLVGAAQIFVSTGNGTNRPLTTPGSNDLSWAAGTKATNYLDNSSKWRDVGYTNTGLELSYEPGYGEVMVDQLLDAARLFKQTLKILLKTELTEGTLENMNLVFGQMDSYLTYANASDTTPGGFSAGAATGTINNTLTPATALAADNATGQATLNLAAGSLGDYPVERSIVAVGNAPGNIGTEESPIDASATKKERIYVARRVVQMQTTAHALKRDGATVFPVQFRCLPDDNDLYDGKEYGVIIDRIWSNA